MLSVKLSTTALFTVAIKKEGGGLLDAGSWGFLQALRPTRPVCMDFPK